VALVNHAHEETFWPVLQALCVVEDVAVSARLVSFCATVRKGGRISVSDRLVKTIVHFKVRSSSSPEQHPSGAMIP
jgi:hypothetical protein